MKWPTWQQAVTLVVVAMVVTVIAGRAAATPARRRVADASQEIAIVAALYALWRLARKLPFASTEGAVDRGRWIDDAQQFLHVPSELSLQHFVLDHESLARFLNAYYAVVHVPSIIAFLVWMYVRHREAYPHWRNVLAITTGACLVIRFLRVAPPRLVPELGYVDLSSVYGMSVYGPVGTGVSDQFAAMPSIHVAWAAIIAFGAVSASTSVWRWLVFAHLPITMIAVSATGHHWWLDGIVAIGIVAAAMWVDGRADTLLRVRRRETAACLTTT